MEGRFSVRYGFGSRRKRVPDYDVTKQFLDACQTYLHLPCVGRLHQILQAPPEGDLAAYVEKYLLARRFFLIDEDISQAILEKMENLVHRNFAQGVKSALTGEKIGVPFGNLVWEGKTKPMQRQRRRFSQR
jgi:hypothetical protein